MSYIRWSIAFLLKTTLLTQMNKQMNFTNQIPAKTHVISANLVIFCLIRTYLLAAMNAVLLLLLHIYVNSLTFSHLISNQVKKGLETSKPSICSLKTTVTKYWVKADYLIPLLRKLRLNRYHNYRNWKPRLKRYYLSSLPVYYMNQLEILTSTKRQYMITSI